MPRTTKGRGKHREPINYDALMAELQSKSPRQGERDGIPPQYRPDTDDAQTSQQEAHEFAG